MDYHLISPTNGKRLHPAGEHFLTDGERRWPVVDGIPFLRPDEELRKLVVADLDGGGARAALRRLLKNQDRFSPTEPPDQEDVDRVIDGDGLNLRTAMDLLNYGPVGDYFAYRWCSPTFTGGLHMLERTPAHYPVVEVACGIGHFLRALEGADREVLGIDIVFSKLWLARKFLGVRGALVCGDIEAGPVIGTPRPTTIFCHDAFYFFEDKEAALTNMRRASSGGCLAIGHVHTKRTTHEAGFALEKQCYVSMTDAFVRDDQEFVLGWYGERWRNKHQPSTAVAWIEGETDHRPIPWLRPGTRLRANPLVTNHGIRWPSDGWAREYGEDSRCLVPNAMTSLIDTPAPADRFEQFRQRRLLNLPPKW